MFNFFNQSFPPIVILELNFYISLQKTRKPKRWYILQIRCWFFFLIC